MGGNRVMAEDQSRGWRMSEEERSRSGSEDPRTATPSPAQLFK